MEAKPFASLSSGLLARKGQAKPAMRPQGFSGFGLSASQRDDLGWNDMGYDVPHQAPQPAVVAVAPVAPPPVISSPPPVVLQREELAVAVALPAEQAEEEEPAVAAPALSLPPRKLKHVAIDAGVANGRKAAFTLRLDGERHLKLRLATAVRNRSAQQLVTEALDRFLADIPELDELAGCVPARGIA
jgi:hypothetical protein